MRSRFLVLTCLSIIGFPPILVESLNLRPGSTRAVAHPPEEVLISPSRFCGGQVTTQNQQRVTKSLNILRSLTFLQTFALTLIAFKPVPHIVALLGPDRTTPLLSKIASSSSLLQIMFAPLLGSLMDRAGRKPIMIMSIGFSSLINLPVIINPSVLMICVSKFIGPLSAELFAISSQAMLTDIVLSNKYGNDNNGSNLLGAAMGQQIAAGGSAVLVGSLVAGHLSKYRIEVSYIASLGLGLLSMLTVTFLMKETLPASAISADPPKAGAFKPIFNQIIRAPSSCLRLLRNHGMEVRILAVLLLIQSLPGLGGDWIQILTKSIWNISTKHFSLYIASFGFLLVLANIVGSVLLEKIGLRQFTVVTILIGICNPLGAILYGFRGMVGGTLVGFLTFAQTLGVRAVLVSKGMKSGASAGELAGEISGLIAILKVIGPILYSSLFTKGKEWFGIYYLPFFFNIGLALIALATSLTFLPS